MESQTEAPRATISGRPIMKVAPSSQQKEDPKRRPFVGFNGWFLDNKYRLTQCDFLINVSFLLDLMFFWCFSDLKGKFTASFSLFKMCGFFRWEKVALSV